MNTLKRSNVEEAIATLQSSARGQQALRDVHGLLDNGGLALDLQGQQAVLVLLCAAFTNLPGTTMELLEQNSHEAAQTK